MNSTDVINIASERLLCLITCNSDNITCLFKNANTTSATSIPSHAALVLAKINPPTDKIEHIDIKSLILLVLTIKMAVIDAHTVKHKYWEK